MQKVTKMKIKFEEYYSFALAVRRSSETLSNATIQDFFHSKELYPIYLDADGQYLESSHKKFGTYDFCRASELEDLAIKYDWPIQSDCPFVDSILGYCLFQPWDNDSFLYFVETVLSAGHGFLAKLDNGVCFDIVSEKTFSLREVVDRHGFDEGALILTETDDYHQYIRNSIKRSLDPLGLKPYSYHAGDHEHILDGFEGDNRNRVKNWEIFELNADKILLKLWIADWDGFNKNINLFEI